MFPLSCLFDADDAERALGRPPPCSKAWVSVLGRKFEVKIALVRNSNILRVPARNVLREMLSTGASFWSRCSQDRIDSILGQDFVCT